MKPEIFFRKFANMPLADRIVKPAGINSLEEDDNLSPYEIYLELNQLQDDKRKADIKIARLLEIASKTMK